MTLSSRWTAFALLCGYGTCFQTAPRTASVLEFTQSQNFPRPVSSHIASSRYVSSSSISNSRIASALSASMDLGNYDHTCDILVLGSGPAARCIASLLDAQDFSVIMADQNADRSFPPNYGVWNDEWDAIVEKYKAAGVDLVGGQCGGAIDRKWDVTDCYFGGSFDIPTEERLRWDRPYYRVDKHALRESLTPSTCKILKANHQSKAINVNVFEPAGSLMHDSTGSTIMLTDKEGNQLSVRSKLILDCTGHETDLVLKDARDPYRPPGFQIAYGMLVDVEGEGVSENQIGPYDKEAMTLFDYRTDHYDSADAGSQAKVESAPTFMYAMPLKGNQIFFEETSLVARPAVSFQECKDRCYRRLEHLGIKVTNVYEEEFCYIPMGGALPAKDQRIVALGGSAAMVHPSTGYHLCRCMMGAADLAQAITSELKAENPNLDRAAASAYHSLWTPENIRQRNFAVFGGEFLMKQSVVGLRGFFDGFFRLPLPMWAGFLAGWPGLPNNDKHESWLSRMMYGLTFVTKLPPSIAADMLASIVGYIISEGVPLAQSVTPFLGEPTSYEYKMNTDKVGDVAVKAEARSMLSASAVEEVIPVAFGEQTHIESPKVVAAANVE